MGRLLVILGAGASAGVAMGNLSSKPDFEPPLTGNLFDKKYERYLTNYPGARALSSTITARARSGSPLERVLADLAEVTEANIAAQLAEVPLYLRDMLGEISDHYVDDPGAYSALIGELQERGLEVFFATLNYDRFLERAIQVKFATTGGNIESIDDYVNDGRAWNLAKLHGSVDWVYLSSEAVEGDVDLVLYRDFAHRFRLPADGPILVQSWNVRQSQGRLAYPALALPSDRKYGFVCPPEQSEGLASFVRKAPSVLVIGTSGKDRDLMDLLASASGSLDLPILVVDPLDPEAVADQFAPIGSNSPQTVKENFANFVASARGREFFDAVAARP